MHSVGAVREFELHRKRRWFLASTSLNAVESRDANGRVVGEFGYHQVRGGVPYVVDNLIGRHPKWGHKVIGVLGGSLPWEWKVLVRSCVREPSVHIGTWKTDRVHNHGGRKVPVLVGVAALRGRVRRHECIADIHWDGRVQGKSEPSLARYRSRGKRIDLVLNIPKVHWKNVVTGKDALVVEQHASDTDGLAGCEANPQTDRGLIDDTARIICRAQRCKVQWSVATAKQAEIRASLRCADAAQQGSYEQG